MSTIMAEAVAESEDRRREFRQYLVDGGVLDAVVKAVVSLYACEDRPLNPVDFVRKVMGDQRPTLEDMGQLVGDVKASVAEQRSLAQDNQRLRARLQELEPDSDLLVSSVVPPELLLPEPEPEPEAEAEEAEEPEEPELVMEEGEHFVPHKGSDYADNEASVELSVRSVQSNAVSEKKSVAIVEDPEEAPRVAASDGGQATD